MDLLDIPLPDMRMTVDIDPSVFLDRCEGIANKQGWKIDRRREYAGPGSDHLNLYVGNGPKSYPMLRMVVTPSASQRIGLDVVTFWKTSPLDYDEYVDAVRTLFTDLLRRYRAAHNKRYRIVAPRRPDRVNLRQVDCGRLSYVAEKLSGLCRSIAIGPADARDRLISAFWTFHVIRPDDLPPPLRKHMTWVWDQITKREPRHRMEGQVEATVRQMKNATAAKILERLVDIAAAVDVLDRRCNGARGTAI